MRPNKTANKHWATVLGVLALSSMRLGLDGNLGTGASTPTRGVLAVDKESRLSA